MPILFEWDPNKARTNIEKHGVSFEDAMQVFNDPFALSAQDQIEDGEYRWRTVGLVGGVVVILVAHTRWGEDEVDEVIRIISARRAERRERMDYERERRKGSSY